MPLYYRLMLLVPIFFFCLSTYYLFADADPFHLLGIVANFIVFLVILFNSKKHKEINEALAKLRQELEE